MYAEAIAHGHSALVTALAYYLIGGALIFVATKVLLTHPINRVFMFGDYLTPRGAGLVMSAWPLVSLTGLFVFSCAVEHHLHWLYNHGRPGVALLLLFMGWIEAAISAITALALCWMILQWRRKGKGK